MSLIGDGKRDSSQAFREESSEGQLSGTSDNNIYFDVVGGRNKKGRVFGLGTAYLKYYTSPSFSTVVSLNEMEVMHQRVSNFTTEMRL